VDRLRKASPADIRDALRRRAIDNQAGRSLSRTLDRDVPFTLQDRVFPAGVRVAPIRPDEPLPVLTRDQIDDITFDGMSVPQRVSVSPLFQSELDVLKRQRQQRNRLVEAALNGSLSRAVEQLRRAGNEPEPSSASQIRRRYLDAGYKETPQGGGLVRYIKAESPRDYHQAQCSIAPPPPTEAAAEPGSFRFLAEPGGAFFGVDGDDGHVMAAQTEPSEANQVEMPMAHEADGGAVAATLADPHAPGTGPIDRLANGLLALQEHRYDSAAILLENYLAAGNEKDAQVRRLLAIALFQTRKPEMATEQLLRAYRDDPALCSQPLRLGEGADEHRAIRDTLRRAVRHANHSGSGDAWFAVAALMQAEQKTDRAGRMLDRAAEHDGDPDLIARFRDALDQS